MTTTTHPHRSVARWFADLFRPRAKPPTELEIAQAEWRAAVARVKALKAKPNPDTRTLHQAYREAHRLSTVAVKLEVRR